MRVERGKRYVATHPHKKGRATVLVERVDSPDNEFATADVLIEEGQLIGEHRSHYEGARLTISVAEESLWNLKPAAA